MGKIRVLNQQEIMSVLDMQSVIEAVKKAFYYKSHTIHSTKSAPQPKMMAAMLF